MISYFYAVNRNFSFSYLKGKKHRQIFGQKFLFISLLLVERAWYNAVQNTERNKICHAICQFVQCLTISGTLSNFCQKKKTNKQTTNNKLLGSIDTEQPVDNSANYTEIESKIYELASWQVATETPNKLGFVNIPSAETYEIISWAETN